MNRDGAAVRAGIAALFVFAVPIAGCTGRIIGTGNARGTAGGPGAGGGSGGPPTSGVDGGALGCNPPGAGIFATPARIRRLTADEYAGTIGSLLGNPPGLPVVSFPPDSAEGMFHNSASTLRVSDALASNLFDGGEALAKLALAGLSRLLPCDPATGADACARQFFAKFGQRAYRRALQSNELDNLMTVYQLGKTGGNFQSGVGLALEVIFQSTNTLFRTELGLQSTGGLVTLTGDEIAAELSFMLSGAPPDDALIQASASGALVNADERDRQARRLLATPGARAAIASFADDWLGIGTVDQVPKDQTRFPGFSPALGVSMRHETETLVSDVVLSGDGLLSTLLMANYTFVDDALANLYGVPPNTPTLGAAVGGMRRVSQPGGNRTGILTNASLLAAHAGTLDSSPTKRGHLVRSQFLCQQVPPPPQSLMVKPLMPSGTLTTRQRIALHASDAQCAACHSMMDPLGFAFEGFDAIGASRTQENGLPVDISGDLTGSDNDGHYADAPGLASRLAGSADVRACFALKMASYAMARPVDNDDPCVLGNIARDFTVGSTSIPELLVALVRSSSFVERIVSGP